MTTVGWIFNLDADLELADPDGFSPSGRLAQQTNVLADRLLASANAASPQVQHVRLALDARPTICQAWCPTPRAQDAAKALGRGLPVMPPLAVIQKVNHRSFAAGFGCGLQGAAFVTSMSQLDAVLQAATPEHGWLLKRPFGFSGRGQKRITGTPAGAERRWAEASMTQYGRGLMVEPFVAIEAEFALHSWLDADGECLTGQPTRLVTDELGGWVDSDRHPDMLESERVELAAAHAMAARALAESGYFGPFSTDAFRYRDASGELRFRALSELNARYSMGFFVGFAERLEEWAHRESRRGC